MKNKIYFFPKRHPKNGITMEKKTVFPIFDNILMKNHANLIFFASFCSNILKTIPQQFHIFIYFYFFLLQSSDDYCFILLVGQVK